MALGSGNNYESMSTRYPSRIVCLTEETTETLYLLGEGDRIVGISGYTVRPPEARHKPKVSAFINARFDKIEALKPDLILAFSDLQADIAAELIRRGYSVVTFNQRSVAEILQMIRMVGAIVGCADRAVALADSLEHGLENIRTKAAAFARRPRVFFEEWDTPLISGICWVDELVEIAGGEPLFPALRKESLAKNRIVSPDEVAARDPEVIIASWCGKAMKKRTIEERPGWDRISAVRADHIYEIKSTYILQPGPAALTEGVTRMHECLARAVRGC
jgi:iron complex transport system substrate-binding protein